MGYFRGKSRRILAGFVLICLALSFVLPIHHNSSKSIVWTKEEKDGKQATVALRYRHGSALCQSEIRISEQRSFLFHH